MYKNNMKQHSDYPMPKKQQVEELPDWYAHGFVPNHAEVDQPAAVLF